MKGWDAKSLAKTPVGRNALFGKDWDKPNQPKPEKIVIGEFYEFVLVIDGRLAGLNEYVNYCKDNHRRSNGLMKKEKARVSQALAISGFKVFKKIDIHCRWVEPNRKRDKDNIRFGLKFIADSFVDAGLIPNDGWANVGELSDSYDVDKDNPRVEVTVSGILANI